MTFGGAGNDIINERVEVHELFPTPLYVVTLSGITEEYKDELSSIERSNNVGNTSSVYKDILNMRCFSRLKFEVNRHLRNYYRIIEKPRNKVEPYITQSWLNWISDNQFHHYHAHPNSMVSGVFYIQCEQTDSIVFELGGYKRLLVDSDRTDRFNTHKYTLPVQKHDLILFPSDLIHGVEDKQENGKDRISLSFNSFVRGILGKYERATELKL